MTNSPEHPKESQCASKQGISVDVYAQKRDVVTLYPKKIEDSHLNSGQSLKTLTLLEIRMMLKEKGLDLRITLNTRNKFWRKPKARFFKDFKRKYLEIVMKQRAFQNCKVLPFFVVPARPQDRNSCCCHQQVEIWMLFRSCMDYRRNIVSNDEERSQQFSVVLTN